MGAPRIPAEMQAGKFLLSLLCFLLTGSRNRCPRLQVRGVISAWQLFPPHREKSFQPHLGINHCKLNSILKNVPFEGIHQSVLETTNKFLIMENLFGIFSS